MRVFNENLTGANCTFGGQTLISLRVTEDADADYDTAVAVCLAPGGALYRGTTHETIEGGVSTGHWDIEEVTDTQSGKETWKRRQGELSYNHIPLVSYRLRRKNWKILRGTLSLAKLGKDHFPPKFCSLPYYNGMLTAGYDAIRSGEVNRTAVYEEFNSWIVTNAAGMIATLCRWFGLNVTFLCNLYAQADHYEPVSKTLLGAIKEIASWSAASVSINREGGVVIYNWEDTFSQSRWAPYPEVVLEREGVQSIYPVNMVTVVGTGFRGTVEHWPARPGKWIVGGTIYRPPSPAYDTLQNIKETPVSYTEAINEAPCAYVEERIEITDYRINPLIAQNIARERLTRAVLQNTYELIRGPAEGSQDIRPIDYKTFQVTRSLNWNGSAYRYDIELKNPTTMMPEWNGSASTVGWW